MSDVITAPGGPYQIRDPEPTGISLIAGSEEMLRCSKEGFWVRGVKVEQDEHEAQKVYEGFKAWMVWAQMSRDYR